jgi:hypothetical protein
MTIMINHKKIIEDVITDLVYEITREYDEAMSEAHGGGNWRQVLILKGANIREKYIGKKECKKCKNYKE